MDALQRDTLLASKVLSFYNMVQAHKTLHKQYLDNRRDASWMLESFIPFYSDIELIGLTKESLFHHEKENKANSYYLSLWLEICRRMQWQKVKDFKGLLVEMNKDQEAPEIPPLAQASDK